MGKGRQMRVQNELREIEQGVIDLENGIWLLRSVIAMSMDRSDNEHITQALYGLERYLESNHNQLQQAFEDAWNKDLAAEVQECLN